MNKSFFFLFVSLSLLIAGCENDESEEVPEEVPVACISSNMGSDATVGNEIVFVNCSENSTSYLWDFGDDSSSDQFEPLHTFRTRGSYTVTLIAGMDRNWDGVMNNNDGPGKYADTTSMVIEVSPDEVTMQLTILNGNSWSPENPQLSPVDNATIKFFKDNEYLDPAIPDTTLYSDEQGVILAYDHEIDADFYIVEKDGMSNILNGFVIHSIYQTQAEIDEMPYQEGAQPGDFKFTDMNGDGVINEDDEVSYGYIYRDENGLFEKTIIIGRE